MVCVVTHGHCTVPYESYVIGKAIVSWNMAWTVFEDGYARDPASNAILEEVEIKPI